MSEKQIEKLRELLLWHKAALEQDLRTHDYSEISSVEYGIHQQIDAINTLLENLPLEQGSIYNPEDYEY